MPGRPFTKLEIDLNDPMKVLKDVERLCNVKNQQIRLNITILAKGLLDMVMDRKTESVQTENETIELISQSTDRLSSYEKSHLVSDIFTKVKREDQVKILFMFYSDLDIDQQSDVFSFLGYSLNDDVYEASNKCEKLAKDLNILDLNNSTKKAFYENCDIRLKSFIDTLTKRKKASNEIDITNYKSNIYENILKARNTKFVSIVGLKEHMVAYLSSGKSRHTSQVFSKQGGKGCRPLLEIILTNSEEVCKFKAPEMKTLFFSFDNIQTLLKSHRIGGFHQKKILAVVVCSIMCLLPDGEEICKLQYSHENTPANWYSRYKFEPEKKIFTDNLSLSALKKCIKLDEEDVKIFNEIFESDLHTALMFVKNDLDENFQDSIDLKTKIAVAKKKKLCSSGHINENVRSNRTVCDRAYCNEKLKDAVLKEIKRAEVSEKSNNIDKQKKKAETYLNLPNILTDQIPKEMSVGAIAVNPNTMERIAKVLDSILESADMKNRFSVKIRLSANDVSKVFNINQDFRKFVMVTADGLPYKVMIDLIKNSHICAECGKKMDYLSNITDHWNETKHCEYFQTYGNILPNIGHFHYALTMLRSLVKLEWNIDYQELCKSIHFETPKALFMQQKVTDFRKSLDTYRTVREAKLRELVTPFVKYAKENNISIDVKTFLMWKKFFVESKSYEAVFQIEKYYGTSFLMFHAALRANNFRLASIAKKVFSPLFHINRHPNYAVMDIHTDYVQEKLADSVPELSKYLNDRKCSNFTRQPYSSEPHDERHEEFNKRGLNMQNIKTADDFKQSFQLIDHYNKMKESCFEDYEIKMHGGNIITIQDYEDNISKMRVCMRKESYLTKPDQTHRTFSLENHELNHQLPNIIDIANKQRQENIMKVIRHNNFNAGYSNDAKLQVLKDETEDKLAINYETQLQILIASEENPELRENLKEYCSASKNHPDFDEEKIVEDILSRNFCFI